MPTEDATTTVAPEKAAALDYLSSTVNAAFDEMERRGWAEVPDETTEAAPADPTPAPSTTPEVKAPAAVDPPAVVDAPKATEPPAEIDLLTGDLEKLRGPDGLLAKKWKTPAAMTDGVHSLIQTAKSALSQRDLLQAELDRVRQAAPSPAAPVTPVDPAAAPTSRVDGNDRGSKRAAVLARMTERYEIAPEDLTDLLDVAGDAGREAAANLASSRDAVQTADTREWDATYTRMREQIPAAFDHVDEMSLWLSANPAENATVQQLVNAGNRDGAFKYAWRSFADSNVLAAPVAVALAPSAADQRAEIEGQAQEQVRAEALAQARRDAGVATSDVSTVHEPVATGPSQADLDNALARHRAGDRVPYNRLTFGKDLKGPFFDGT